MDITPSHLTAAEFRTVRKGYDPDEVDEFLAHAAKALEQAQQHATAMEARARAAVARLQEATAAQPAGGGPTSESDGEMPVGADEAATISRTLLLAQRTADTTIADARAEAERITAEAQRDAESTLDSTREMSAQLIADARAEARQASEQEREVASNEVEALKARREFLVGDVDQLEHFLIEQRERLRGAAQEIEALCQRVPSGLGSVRPPALSAADDSSASDAGESGGEAAERSGGGLDPTEPIDAVDGASAGEVTDAEPDDDTAEMDVPPNDDDTEAEFHRLAARAAGTSVWEPAKPEAAELIVPPEAGEQFADIDELVEAIDDQEGLLAADGDAADRGPNVAPHDAPNLPKRSSAAD